MKLVKVYIAPSGMGLGHVTRSASIANELNKKGADTLFSTYLDGIEYIRKMGFKLKEAKPITYQASKDGSVDFKKTATNSGFTLGIHRFMKQVIREIQNIGSYDPDIIFSDSRASTIIAAKLLRKPIILLLNQFRVEIIGKPKEKLKFFDMVFFAIANFFWIFARTLISGVWMWSDYILVPDYPAPYTISINNLKLPKRIRKRVRLIGPIISTKPMNLPDVRDIRKDFGFEFKKPLIYAAISGPGKERFYLIKKLSTILQILPNNYQIILTKGSPGSKSKSVKKENVIFYDWVDEVEQSMLLKASDAIISRAGHGIITKSLAYGKPLILIPIPNQTEQYGNAFRAKKLGVAEVIEQQELNEINLRQSIDNVIKSNFYDNAKKFIEVASVNDGVEFATDLIIKIANSTKR